MTPNLLSGVLQVDKHPGVTSHDIVETVRRMSPPTGGRVGHTGTLDPFATGLLLVIVGKATKYQNDLTDLPKTYEMTAQFGARSDTGDPDGEIEVIGGKVQLEEVAETIKDFRGDILQSVPMTSAIRVGGERLYKKAHRGERVETPTRVVRIESIELLDFDEQEQSARLRVNCGKGAYMRQLVEDIGSAVGNAAYCSRLRRTCVGGFTVDNSVRVDQLGDQTDIGSLEAWKPLTVSFGGIRVV